jgi:diguanylate cyclase (GGDEF)-like protein
MLTTVSAGIATAPPWALSQSDLFHAADRALYQAKANGRNRVELARQ